MVQADFQSLGVFIGRQNPYSTDPKIPAKLSPDGGPGVLTVDDKNSADRWVLNWDFREPTGSNDVVNYRISRAIVIPTWYVWEAESPKGRPPRILYANLLIGYTPPTPVASFSTYQTFTDTPSGGTGTGTYEELGEIIERRFPFHPAPTLVSQVDGNGDLDQVVTAESFLAGFSNASATVFQLNGAAMTLAQRQQCLYWDGPRRTGPMAAEPGASSTVDGTFDGGGLANYQITKAFRLPYEYVSGGQTFRGLILIGHNGSGDG
jgi:hypothetical protein